MEEEKFWQLLSVKLTGEATEEELCALEQLLLDNPGLGLHAQVLVQMWESSNAALPANELFFNRHLQRMSLQPDGIAAVPLAGPESTAEARPARKIKKIIFQLAGIAAVISGLVIWYNTGFMAQPGKKKNVNAWNTVSTRRGSKSTVQLPDGTVAWLNAESRLSYNENFQGDIREVSLEGEAYFDVVKDKSRPFIIHTRTIDIRVLGTAFNVRAYPSEHNTETSLFRGSVEVTLHNNPEKKIVLRPNEKLMVNNGGNEPVSGRKDNKRRDINIQVGKVHFQARDSTAWETGWIKNKLVFDAETLEEVAGKIERWYDVKVILPEDQELRHTQFSGVFDNETLSEVMEALKITGNFRYNINKNAVTIR
jgi:transmembrane sensor